jgi:hypothetical protein
MFFSSRLSLFLRPPEFPGHLSFAFSHAWAYISNARAVMAPVKGLNYSAASPLPGGLS